MYQTPFHFTSFSHDQEQNDRAQHRALAPQNTIGRAQIGHAYFSLSNSLSALYLKKDARFLFFALSGITQRFIRQFVIAPILLASFSRYCGSSAPVAFSLVQIPSGSIRYFTTSQIPQIHCGIFSLSAFGRQKPIAESTKRSPLGGFASYAYKLISLYLLFFLSLLYHYLLFFSSIRSRHYLF